MHLLNPLNWCYSIAYRYFDSFHDLIVNDHHSIISSEAFAIRNSPWSHSFVEEWSQLSSALSRYPFKESGAFAETILRFGAKDLLSSTASNEAAMTKAASTLYRNNTCRSRVEALMLNSTANEAGNTRKELPLHTKMMQHITRLSDVTEEMPYSHQILSQRDRSRTNSSLMKMLSKKFARCISQQKNIAMGPWERERHRSLGRIKFVSTASGFGAYVKKSDAVPKNIEETAQKADKYPLEELTSFSDGNFIVHSQNFRVRVSAPSISCPQVTNSSFQLSREDGSGPQFLPPIDVFSQNEGVYMISVDGACDMSRMDCKRLHFPLHLNSLEEDVHCSKRHLMPFSRIGIRTRKGIIRGMGIL